MTTFRNFSRPSCSLEATALIGVLLLALTGCGGSSGGAATGSVADNANTTADGADNPVTDGSDANTDGSDTDIDNDTDNDSDGSEGNSPDPANNTDVDETDGDINFATAASGLSHPGQLLPKGPNAAIGDAFVSETGRSKVAAMSQSLAVVYEVVENHGNDIPESCKALAAEFSSCSVVNIHIKDSNASLDDGNWRLYFPSIRRVLRVDNDEFDVFLVNGDLNYIAPTENFSGFSSTAVKSIKIIAEFSQLHESDMMPRYFLVRGNGAAEIIANTDNPSSISEYAVEISGDNRLAFNGEPQPLADSSNRHQKFSAVSTTDVAATIVPTPQSTVVTGGTFDISGGISFGSNALPSASAAALNSRANLLVGGGGNAVQTTVDSSMASGSYELVVDDNGIQIRGSDQQAVFHGGQSLLALITPGSGSIPQVSVTDAPRFGYRGMHVDVARNFHPADRLRKLIDQMAAYKMNVLHLHLTDDEGWRIEIPGLPELTDVGGKRQFALDSDGNPTEANALLPQLGSGPFANTEGNGFFSRSEFVALLRYANDRYVQIIPEIDMPAHARAAVVSMRARAANMGQPGNTGIRLDDPADDSRYLTVQHYNDGILNPCIDGTFNFVQTVVTEIKSMFDEAGTPLDVWHMGGDEALNVYLGAGFEDLSAGSVTPWKGDIDQSQFDPPWERSPACQALIAADSNLNTLEDLNKRFVVKVSEIVSNAGIPAMYAYQDILRNIDASDLATTEAGVGFWEVIWSGGYASAYEWLQRGYETVIAVPDYLYFDFPQEIDPKERGYYWATRFTDTQKVFSFAPENLPQNAENTLTRDGNPFTASGSLPYTGFKGIQGQLWSETVRTAEHFDYMMFPRLLALAERAWHRADWELDYAPGTNYSQNSNRVDAAALAADWSRFANALGQKELPKLDSAGVLYRVPSAGAVDSGGVLDINTQYPGLPLQYSNDGNNWQNYNPANKPVTAAQVRVLSANGSRTGRATPVN